MVFFSPSSKDTSGSQFKIFFARVISGHLRSGSSTIFRLRISDCGMVIRETLLLLQLGYEQFNFSLKYFIVFSNPVSKGTLGSQPNIFRA